MPYIAFLHHKEGPRNTMMLLQSFRLKSTLSYTRDNRYDTAVDDKDTPSIFVSDYQTLPMYLIS